jgi:hypothetical protein
VEAVAAYRPLKGSPERRRRHRVRDSQQEILDVEVEVLLFVGPVSVGGHHAVVLEEAKRWTAVCVRSHPFERLDCGCCLLDGHGLHHLQVGKVGRVAVGLLENELGIVRSDLPLKDGEELGETDRFDKYLREIDLVAIVSDLDFGLGLGQWIGRVARGVGFGVVAVLGIEEGLAAAYPAVRIEGRPVESEGHEGRNL